MNRKFLIFFFAFLFFTYTYAQICGDSITDPPEECDDGNAVSGDGCSSDCQIETGFMCDSDGLNCMPICGDSLIVGTETCDDGNILNNDGCSSNCQIENGFICVGIPSSCNPTDNGIATESSNEGNQNGGIIIIAILIPCCLITYCSILVCYYGFLYRKKKKAQECEHTTELDELNDK